MTGATTSQNPEDAIPLATLTSPTHVIEAIHAKACSIAEGVFKSPYMDKRYLEPERVTVTPLAGGAIELKFEYPDYYDLSTIEAKDFPKVMEEEFVRLGLPRANVNCVAGGYKDYDWMCYSGTLRAVFESPQQCLKTLEEVVLGNISARANLIEAEAVAIKEYVKALQGLEAVQVGGRIDLFREKLEHELSALLLPRRPLHE